MERLKYIQHLISALLFIYMDLQFPVSECPPLSSLYCRTLTLTFHESLPSLETRLHPLLHDLKDKQLLKCYLVPTKQSIPKPKYEAVLLGGTFDYFHIGHQLLLLTAILEAGKRVLVGVTGDGMLGKKKGRELIQPVHIRMKEVESYIKRIKPDLVVEVVEIADPYGPAIVREDFDAIAVSEETKAGADKINQIRKERGLKQLAVQLCPLMSETSKIEVKVSSSDTREYMLHKNNMKIEDFEYYKQKWLELNKELSRYLKVAPNIKVTEIWWDCILCQYSEYWRHYHTNQHILEMLRHWDRINGQGKGEGEGVGKLSEIDELVVKVGLWFHDLEYVPPAKDNEERSAELAGQFLLSFQEGKNESPLLNELIGKVRQAILSTKHHKSESLASKVLIDLDMAILDSNAHRYSRYAESIRKQYQPIVKEAYNEKRSQFLSSLNPTSIFYFYKPTHLEANIKWELEKLGKKQQL